MEESLVYIEPATVNAVPFTTSEIIAEHVAVKHHAIQQLLAKHQEDFEEFGSLAFEMRVKTRKVGATTEKIYRLNEEQATLLITYLKNTPAVRAFKVELVRQFYAMRRELTRRAVAREARKPTRRELTDAIRDCVPDSPHKSMMYPNYSKLAYKAALGRSVKHLREDKGAPPRGNLAEYLTAEETAAVKKMESRIAVLLELGFSYSEIKAALDRSVCIVATERGYTYGQKTGQLNWEPSGQQKDRQCRAGSSERPTK